MTMKCLIVADDFTGANDTGVQMKKRGLPVQVKLSAGNGSPGYSVVLDTETRNSDPESAYELVKEMAAKQLDVADYDLVYKKMDSTLRGNVVKEIRAMIEVYQPEKVIFAPAFPEIGRTTKNGVHFLKDTPLMETEFARDPLNPIKTDNITQMMEQLFNEKVKHHTVEDIINKNIQLKEARCHTFDCDSEISLLKLSETLKYEKAKILWVGSAGLAQALFKTMVPSRPVFAVMGSVSEVSLKQLNYAERNAVDVVKVEPENLLNKEIDTDIISEVRSKLEEKRDVILTAARTKEDYQSTVDYAKKMGISSSECSIRVQTVLAEMSCVILEKVSVSGLFLTGGATAISVMQALNISSVEIKSELCTGMVHSISMDGSQEKLAIITRAGAFGHEKDMLTGINKLKELG